MPQKPPDIFQQTIADYLRLLRQPFAAPGIFALPLSTVLRPREAERPCALLLSPHPDDECLTGALPLRLKLEQNWRIVNLAMTLGSDAGRRPARKAELAKACGVLGFDCVLSAETGFENLSRQTREDNAPAWQQMVARLREIITHYKPQAIFMPHGHDMHPAHIGSGLLGIDALASLPDDFACTVLLTEYWHPLDQPNLMIGIGEDDAAQLLSALACHTGENTRNPFDVRFPAYLIDNVRRGSERVGGKGVTAAQMDFAMLYRLGLWRGGKLIPSALNRVLAPQELLGELLDL